LFILAILTYKTTIMDMDPGLYRSMEGATELEFCNDEGDITASLKEQREFLLKEGYKEDDVNNFIEFMKVQFDIEDEE
jgi:hypothetical protein